MSLDRPLLSVVGVNETFEIDLAVFLAAAKPGSVPADTRMWLWVDGAPQDSRDFLARCRVCEPPVSYREITNPVERRVEDKLARRSEVYVCRLQATTIWHGETRIRDDGSRDVRSAVPLCVAWAGGCPMCGTVHWTAREEPGRGYPGAAVYRQKTDERKRTMWVRLMR